jgi:hypothetical protein
MIKKTTVLKRMIKKGAPMVAFGVAFAATLTLLSIGAERFLGWDYNATYWGLFGLAFIAYLLKMAYDANRFAIEMEQKQMLRDIERERL